MSSKSEQSFAFLLAVILLVVGVFGYWPPDRWVVATTWAVLSGSLMLWAAFRALAGDPAYGTGP